MPELSENCRHIQLLIRQVIQIVRAQLFAPTTSAVAGCGKVQPGIIKR